MTDMSQYDSNASIDFNLEKELKELGDRNTRLNQEKDEIEKQHRTLLHNYEQTVNEVKMENEKLLKTVASLEKLVESLKKDNNKDDFSEKDNILCEKEKRISLLETNVLLLEQSLQDVKRQRQSINMQNANLKFEIEKLKLNESSGSSGTKINTEDENELTLEEAKNLISDFMTEIDDLKKEKEDMGEKALQLLSEKEIEKMELSEKLEQMEHEKRNEIKALMNQLQEYREKLIEMNGGKEVSFLFYT